MTTALGWRADLALVARYVGVVAFASTAYIGAFTAGALAAPELSGERATSGLPNAIGIGATAVAASVLSIVMARRGRRAGLVSGFALGVIGAFVALVALLSGSLAILLVGAAALGVSNAAIQLTRYAASDGIVPERRARVIGLVVWGSTVGAVLGPNLLGPAAAIAGMLGRDRLEGAFGLTFLAMLGALLLSMTLPAGRPVRDAVVAATPAASRWQLLGQRTVQVALVGMVASQAVMMLLMTMTPLHVQEGGHDIGTVGLVISAHTLGMFALSPISALLVGRFGAIRIMLAGFGVLALAGALAAASQEAVPLLALALFLLGWGWSLSFVAGSSLLARGVESAARVRLQGTTDTLVWGAGAVASLSAGPLLGSFGYASLGAIVAVAMVIPVAAIIVLRGPMSGATQPA